MKEWQFDVLFFVAIGGTVFLLVAPAIGMDEVPNNPGAITGIGTILAYVLTQKRSIIKDNKKGEEEKEKDPSDGN